MPTTRKRRARGRAKLPLMMEQLFMLGCGKAKHTEAEARALWKEHGRQFLNNIPAERAARGGFAANPFFFNCYGPPENMNTEEKQDADKSKP